MDTTKLEVGQQVYVDGGFGLYKGTVVKIEPPCIYVEYYNGRLRFNYEGRECGPSGKTYDTTRNTIDPGPWEITGPVTE